MAHGYLTSLRLSGLQDSDSLRFLAHRLLVQWLLFQSQRTRDSFLLLVSFSSGFGWLPVLWWWLTKQRPPFFFVDVSPELTMPEANSFLSLMVAPLAASGVTLVMASLGCLLWCLSLQGKRSFYFFTLATLFGILVVNVHTYAAVPMLIAVFFWQLMEIFRTKRLHLRELSLPFLFCLIITLFFIGQAALFSRDPAFLRKAETPTLTPNPVILIGSYGFIALGALLGLTIARKKWLSGEKKEWAIPIAWLFAILVSINLPVSFQRKMIEGLHVVLCLLTVLAIEKASEKVSEQERSKERKNESKKFKPVQKSSRLQTYAIALLIVSIPSQIAFFALNGYWLVHNNLIYDERFNPPYSRMMMPPYYLLARHLQLFRWTEENAKSDEAILCHPMLGNYLPVLTGKKVFIGHWAETLNFGRKLKVAMAIWRGVIPPDEAKEIFRQHKIRYAIETDFERSASQGECHLHRYGKVAFQIGEDRIFRLDW